MANDLINWKTNSFILLRYIAAFQIVIGHCLFHFEFPADSILQWIFRYFLKFIPGVPIFFGMSGFLMWASLSNNNNLFSYLKNRLKRIYPELWGSVLVSILSIIILYRKYDMKSLILFTLTQSSFLQFWTPQNLREFGCGTPNGSLWTIGIFIQFYITAYILYRWIKPTLLYEHSHITFKFVLLGIISICCTIAYPRMTIFFDGGINSVYYKLIGQTIFPYLYMFLTGIIIFEYKEYLLHNFQRYTLLYFTLLYFTL